MTKILTWLWARVVGDPPPRDAAREFKLRYQRRFFLRWNLPLLVAFCVATVVFLPPGFLLVLVVLTILGLFFLAAISREIDRECTHQPPDLPS